MQVIVYSAITTVPYAMHLSAAEMLVDDVY